MNFVDFVVLLLVGFNEFILVNKMGYMFFCVYKLKFEEGFFCYY